MFHKIDLDIDNNIFKQLLESTIFEDVTDGRKGGVDRHAGYITK